MGELLRDLGVRTLRDPRSAVQRLIGLGLPAPVLWQALAAVLLVTVLLDQITLRMFGSGPVLWSDAAVDPLTLAMVQAQEVMLASPMTHLAVQGAAWVLSVFLLLWIGRIFGGTGTLEGALAVFAWFQLVFVALGLASAVLVMALPPVAGLVQIGLLVLVFWIMTMFVAGLHGFRRPGVVFAMILCSMGVIAFALVILLSLLMLPFTGGIADV